MAIERYERINLCLNQEQMRALKELRISMGIEYPDILKHALHNLYTKHAIEKLNQNKEPKK